MVVGRNGTPSPAPPISCVGAIPLPSIASARGRFSLAFSSSSAISRRASDTSTPPHLAFQVQKAALEIPLRRANICSFYPPPARAGSSRFCAGKSGREESGSVRSVSSDKPDEADQRHRARAPRPIPMPGCPLPPIFARCASRGGRRTRQRTASRSESVRQPRIYAITNCIVCGHIVARPDLPPIGDPAQFVRVNDGIVSASPAFWAGAASSRSVQRSRVPSCSPIMRSPPWRRTSLR